MNILQTEEERIRRTKAEQRDLSQRFAVKMFVRRLLLACSVACLLSAAVILVSVALVKGTPLLAALAAFVFIGGGVLGFWRASRMLDELGFMRYTLKEYQDFLEKTKGKA